MYKWRGEGTTALHPNLTGPDPVMNELYRDDRFREALSIGISHDPGEWTDEPDILRGVQILLLTLLDLTL